METAPSFVQWLHSQARGDVDRTQPYAMAYEIGALVESVLGSDDFDMAEITSVLRAEIDDPALLTAYLEALTHAEANWRIDRLCYAHPDAVSAHDTSEDGALLPILAPHEEPALRVLDLPCGFRDTSGRVCGTTAVPGAARCMKHGGAITDPEVRRSLLMVAYAKLIEGSETAVDALLDVAESSRSDMARVQAAKELLDRAGVVQDQHIHLHSEADVPEEDVIANLRDRLSVTRERLRLVAIPVTSAVVEEVGLDRTG